MRQILICLIFFYSSDEVKNITAQFQTAVNNNELSGIILLMMNYAVKKASNEDGGSNGTTSTARTTSSSDTTENGINFKVLDSLFWGVTAGDHLAVYSEKSTVAFI